MMQSQKSEVMLKNMTHSCGTCGEVLCTKKFVTGTIGMDLWYEAVEKDIFLRGVCAICLACKKKNVFQCEGAAFFFVGRQCT